MNENKIFLVQRSFSGKRLHEKILSMIKDFPNPYPEDIFTWDNPEKITDIRGKYNKMFFTIVENTKDDIIKMLVEEELENHEKCVEFTPEVLKRIRKEVFEFMETNYIQSYREENIVKNTINEFQKALLKKLEVIRE